MTARVLAPPLLPELVPPLFADRHLVLLVPASADVAWAARTAWAFARAAATGSRSVLLVDLAGDGPALDAGATRTPARSIAEVFLTDEPLNDAAAPQDRPGLFYIPRGARAGGFEPIWSSDRWTRLARGFASEGALLLLYAPPSALPLLGFEPDGLVVLAPQGFDPANGTFPHVADRVARGTQLLAVVGDDVPRPVVGSSARPAVRRSSIAHRRRGPARFRRVPTLVIAVAMISGAVALLAGRPDATVRPPPESASPLRPAAPLEADAGQGDSLYYSVQVASFNTLAQAMTRAAQIDGAAPSAIVSPVRMGNQGIWYRVLAGALPSARAADSLLQVLWHSGRVERPQGTILRTPEAYRVGRRAVRADAQNDARGLRERGVPAYVVGAPDGTARVYVGAFDLPEQARDLDSLLSAAGVTGTLVRRMGTAP